MSAKELEEAAEKYFNEVFQGNKELVEYAMVKFCEAMMLLFIDILRVNFESKDDNQSSQN